MSRIVAIRDGLATRLATISGLRAVAFMPDKISVPQAIVGEVELEFDKTFGRGLDELEFKVRVYASRAADRSGQRALDGYLAGSGDMSVKAALEGDRTLGGTCHTLQVQRVDGYGVYTVADTQYLGAEFTVLVHARGGS